MVSAWVLIGKDDPRAKEYIKRLGAGYRETSTGSCSNPELAIVGSLYVKLQIPIEVVLGIPARRSCIYRVLSPALQIACSLSALAEPRGGQRQE